MESEKIDLYLDILHIALAEQQEATLVVTGDHRQAQLCHQLDINVAFIGEAKP